MEQILQVKHFQVLLVVIVMDCFFGILRAIKQKKINSTIGIDGIIRKVGMIASILFLIVLNQIAPFNFLGFLPETIKTTLNLEDIGIDLLFNIMFIVFEFLSVLKNMYLCGMPIPKKLKKYLEKLLKEFTNEVKEEK